MYSTVAKNIKSLGISGVFVLCKILGLSFYFSAWLEADGTFLSVYRFFVPISRPGRTATEWISRGL